MTALDRDNLPRPARHMESNSTSCGSGTGVPREGPDCEGRWQTVLSLAELETTCAAKRGEED